MTFIRQLELIERIDQLIRLQATGRAHDLANRLGVSKTKLYRMINIMKELNAPVEYDVTVQSYVYQEEVSLRFRFHVKRLEPKRTYPIAG